MNDYVNLWITIGKEKSTYQFDDDIGIPQDFSYRNYLSENVNEKADGKLPTLHDVFKDNFIKLSQYISNEIKNNNNKIHVRLIIQDKELGNLYWEALPIAENRIQKYSLSEISYAFSRCYEVNTHISIGHQKINKIKVLLVIANSRNGNDAEIAVFDEIQKSNNKDFLYEIYNGPADLEDIKQVWKQNLRSGNDAEGFNILYFIGNGGIDKDDPYILFEEEDGNSTKVSISDFEQIMDGFGEVPLVIFSPGLHSDELQQEFSIQLASRVLESGRRIPAVISLRNGMKPENVKIFTTYLIEELIKSFKGKEDKTIDHLVNNIRHKIWHENREDRDNTDCFKPVLFMQGDGVLFQTLPAQIDSEKTVSFDNIMNNTFKVSNFNTDTIENENGIYIFCRHVDNDAGYLPLLKKALDPYSKYKKSIINIQQIRTINDIPGGENVENEIMKNMEESNFIIFLVSQDFLNENNIQEKEIPKAKEKKDKKEAVIYPILWDYSSYEDFLGDIKVYSMSGEPLSSCPKPEQVKFFSIEMIKDIKKIIKENPWIMEKHKKSTYTGSSLNKGEMLDLYSKIKGFNENQIKNICEYFRIDYDELKGSDKAKLIALKCSESELLMKRALKYLTENIPF